MIALAEKYQVMPPLTDEEYEALKADIAERGVQVPVEYDEEGNILDGYHRVRACLELGITDWPKVVRRGLSEAQKYEHAVQLNVARRQLSREEKQRAVARLREQGWTLERISKATKTPVSTIGRWVDELSQMGKLEQPAVVVGEDGKARPPSWVHKTEAPAHDVQPAPAKDEADDVEAPAVEVAFAEESPKPVEVTEVKGRDLSVHFSSERMDWATPWPFFRRLDAEFGFTLDVCALPETAKCARFFTPEDDGLAQPWSGVCWMNPPYGNEIADWMKKAYEESRKGATVVCLVPSRTDTNWWHEYAMKADEIRFVRGRLKFEGAETSAPFPSAVVILRPGSEGPPRVSGVRVDE